MPVAFKLDSEMRLTGQMTQQILTRLRELLGIKPFGRLTDDYDQDFGRRRFTLAGTPTELALSRGFSDDWWLQLSFDGARPDDTALGTFSADIERAVTEVGLGIGGTRQYGRPASAS